MPLPGLIERMAQFGQFTLASDEPTEIFEDFPPSFASKCRSNRRSQTSGSRIPSGTSLVKQFAPAEAAVRWR